MGATIAEAQRDPASAEDWRSLACIKLFIFTGARLSEILTLRWEYIDWNRGTARLPDSKTGRKNLFLTQQALEILLTVPTKAAAGFVFPGLRVDRHFVGIQKPWQRIRKIADLDDVRIHDLRHAFASIAVSAGDSLYAVGAILGHRQSSTTQRYAHLAAEPVRAVADRTANRIANLLEQHTESRSSEGVALIAVPRGIPKVPLHADTQANAAEAIHPGQVSCGWLKLDEEERAFRSHMLYHAAWTWVHGPCKGRPECRKTIPFYPFIVRYGLDASKSVLDRVLRCAECRKPPMSYGMPPHRGKADPHVIPLEWVPVRLRAYPRRNRSDETVGWISARLLPGVSRTLSE